LLPHIFSLPVTTGFNPQLKAFIDAYTFMSLNRFFSSILAVSGASLLPMLCSVADARVFALFNSVPLSFVLLQI